MPILFYKGGKPSFTNGVADPGGAEEFDRVQSVRCRMPMKREITGTTPETLAFTIGRDCTQGTKSDMLAHKTMFGADGTGSKTVFPLDVLLVDDTRKGKPAWVGTFHCEKAIIKSVEVLDGIQTITFHASEWYYLNGKTGKEEPEDDKTLPVITRGFDETVDGSKP